MSEEQKPLVNDELPEELEIFGRSKSKEEIKAEKAAAKQAEKEAIKAYRRQKREASGAAKTDRKEVLTITAILLGVVVFCGVLFGIQFARDEKARGFEWDESRDYFEDYETQPEMLSDGLDWVLNECYYTKGGYLCTKFTFSNGMETDQHLQELTVEVADPDTGETIAKGFTDTIAESYTIPAGGTNEYTLYLSPEHVLVTDAALVTLETTVEYECVSVDE